MQLRKLAEAINKSWFLWYNDGRESGYSCSICGHYQARRDSNEHKEGCAVLLAQEILGTKPAFNHDNTPIRY
jgi:hypothetical protein